MGCKSESPGIARRVPQPVDGYRTVRGYSTNASGCCFLLLSIGRCIYEKIDAHEIHRNDPRKSVVIIAPNNRLHLSITIENLDGWG